MSMFFVTFQVTALSCPFSKDLSNKILKSDNLSIPRHTLDTSFSKMIEHNCDLHRLVRNVFIVVSEKHDLTRDDHNTGKIGHFKLTPLAESEK